MSAKEEQEQELEILESIYPDELEKLSDTKFNIHFALETNPRKFLSLEVEYPDEYPEVVPLLAVEFDDGSYLGLEPEEADEFTTNEEFDKQDLKELLEMLNENAEENLGMTSIFTLASLLKDGAEDKYAGKVAQREKKREDEILAQEEKDNAKFRGTAVTKESFEAWRKKFREEFKLDEQVKSEKAKLTGREIFEQGLNKDADEDDEDLANDVTSQLTV